MGTCGEVRVRAAPHVSAIVMAQDEERNLARCLASLAWADEIVVVDGGSRDATVAIAERHGARVHRRPWPGYTEQRRTALTQARGEWVVSLDADEALEPALAAEIRAALADAPDSVAGYTMPRKCCYLGRWILHGELYPDTKLRVLRRSRARVVGGHVHETFEVDGEVRALGSHILHYSYDGLGDHARRMRRYGRLVALDRHEAGDRASAAAMLREPVARAWGHLVGREGWRDGARGFLIAGMLAYYVLRQQIELRRLARGSGQAPDVAPTR